MLRLPCPPPLEAHGAGDCRRQGVCQRAYFHVQAHGKTGGEAQEWVRAMLGTVGRGGNAQAVRDEILHIMHRNHIGEKRGTWMEVGPSLGLADVVFA